MCGKYSDIEPDLFKPLRVYFLVESEIATTFSPGKVHLGKTYTNKNVDMTMTKYIRAFGINMRINNTNMRINDTKMGMAEVLEERNRRRSLDPELVAYEEDRSSLMSYIDSEFVGGSQIKRRLNEIATFCLMNKVRSKYGVCPQAVAGHMAFVGKSGTGKSKIAQLLGHFLYRLGFLEDGHFVKVTRHDLVGQYIGHTAPRTKSAIESAMKGVLYIKNAHNIYRPGNERDYGAEAIDIILQMMELRRAEFVLVFSGPKEKMGTLYSANPGLSSRITHHIEFEDFGGEELLELADRYADYNHLLIDSEIRKLVGDFLAQAKRLRRTRKSTRSLLKTATKIADKASSAKAKVDPIIASAASKTEELASSLKEKIWKKPDNEKANEPDRKPEHEIE